jgi:hypothetical protein
VLFVGVLVGLVAVALAVPLDLSFRLRGMEPLVGRITVGWLFGLVRLRVDLPGKEHGPDPGRRPQAKARRSGRGPMRALAVLRQAAFRDRVWRFLGALLRALHPDEFRLRLRLGLGDPADTGRLWAALAPLAVALPHTADVRIEPDFLEPALDFDTSGRLRVVPLALLALAFAFALSPPSLRAWRTLVARRG